MLSTVRLPGNAVLQSWTGSVPEDLLPTQRHPSQVSLLLFLCQFLSPFSVPLSVSQLLLPLLPLSLLPPSPPSLSSLHPSSLSVCRESYEIGRGCPTVGAVKQVNLYVAPTFLTN